MTFIGPEVLGYQDTVTGDTTDSYADALDWNCEGFREKTIILKNTHASYDLKYKVLSRAAYDGVQAEEVSETTLAAGDSDRIARNNAYARLQVQVKAAVGGSQASYQLDYCGLPAVGGS